MLFSSVLTGLRTRTVMQAEIIALRHQLTVFQRNQKPKRLVLKRGDRFLWVGCPGCSRVGVPRSSWSSQRRKAGPGVKTHKGENERVPLAEACAGRAI